MLDYERVFYALRREGVCFYAGVPDSYLNGFCDYALRHIDRERYIIAANEGNAIGVAVGHYLSTREIPLVFMQNSGIGNALNPLVSLVDEAVYSVPMVLLIGWRGEPGKGDWPQHKLQGEITEGLMDLMRIPFSILSDDIDDFQKKLNEAVRIASEERRAYALIVPKGVLTGKKPNEEDDNYPLSREDAIETVLDCFPSDTVYVASTGRITRELFYLRKRRGEDGRRDILNVGSMGHASSIGLGVAMGRGFPVVCLDGDAAAIMHMGALAIIGQKRGIDYTHIVLNNGQHESVGGQPSAGYGIDLTLIAEACGYKTAGKPIVDRRQMESILGDFRIESVPKNQQRPAFIDVRIHSGIKSALPPLDFDHQRAIDEFMEEVGTDK